MSSIAIRLIPAALIALTAMSGSWAGEIYKWTDRDGTVHYTDKPAADGSSERLAIESRSTDRQRVAALNEARRDARTTAREELEAAARESSAEEQARLEEERAEQCTLYRERMERFVQSRRLYREDEDGERVYLDEEEMQKARDDVQSKIEEYCNN